MTTQAIEVDYRAYIRSPAWARKRAHKVLRDGKLDELAKLVIARSGRFTNTVFVACERCGDRHNVWQLEFHHKTYERLGHELLEDLEMLCPECHARQHGKPATLWEEALAAVERRLTNPPAGERRD